jgi:UDP-xylose/UDP-N-acetylglucosamine transporter B4
MSLLLIFFKEWILVLALIFGGCCSNVYSLEVLTKVEPTSGNLITFCQFLLIATEGLFFQITAKGLKQRKIPLQNWGLMVCLFFTVSVLNNYALRFNIPMPLHIVFRSGSVMVSMLLGYTFFNRKFAKFQIIGVFLVTIGVIISTIASNNHTSTNESPLKFLFGLGVLSLALIISCLLGQYQQIVYTKYGRHWREGLFYTHALCLPWFGLFYNDIINQIQQYNKSPLISVGEYLSFGVQYIEKSNIYNMIHHLHYDLIETKLGHLLLEYQIQFLEFKSIGIIVSAFYSYLAQFSVLLNSFLLPRLWLFLIINVLTQCSLLLI